VRPDGTVLEIRGAPLPSGGFVTSYADITEHRRAQSELAAARDQAERASAAKSQFLANMSHELRTPLNAVIGYSDIMAMELFGPLGHARYQEYVRSIHTSGSYLLALIEDVLSLSRIEAESTDVTPLALDLVSLVDETLTVLGTLAGGRVAVETPARADVLADRRAVLQILVNVVGNALKFSGNRPVDLSVSEGQTTVTVEVTDRGDGIPESELQRITEPFYTRPRNSMVAADENEGCGLGLAITQKLLDALGARMMVASAEGQGTTVTIELPRAHSQAYPDTNPLDVAGGASGPHDPPSETAAAE
jgi:two-component system cell cycle sensor histidine kinase PleC